MGNPTGADYFSLVYSMEQECERKTHEEIPKLGRRVPECYRRLGDAMLMLDGAASCCWGCRGGDHNVEYLLGRASSLARAALRLLLFGFYDESLNLTRSIGELANLLLLFTLDQTRHIEWKVLPDEQRRRQFSAVKVRLALEDLAQRTRMDITLLVVDEHRYGALSAASTHVTPATSPQNYNPLGIPVNGGLFQEIGLTIGLNELCRAVGTVLVTAPKLLAYDDARSQEAKDVAAHLIAAVGAIDVMTDWRNLPRQSKTDA